MIKKTLEPKTMMMTIKMTMIKTMLEQTMMMIKMMLEQTMMIMIKVMLE
jgi:hypothetical protein